MLIVISLCHCNDLPSRTEVESSINRTVDEVERLIRQNATLPQLTRREIIDILFNITSKDVETYRNKKTIEEARNIYQKALMVVLPYSAEDARENIKDLYTKPPIVEFIADLSSNPENFETSKNKKLQAKTLIQEHDKQSLENFIVTYAPEKNLPKENLPAEYKNHRDTYSEGHSNMSVKETLKFDSAPIKFSFNLENLQKPIFTERPAITKRPVFEGSSLTKDEEVYVVYSTSATIIPPGTVEMKKNVSMLNLGSEMTSRPLKYNENVLSVDKWRYNAPTTPSTTTLTKFPDFFKRIRDKQPLFPTIRISLENMTSTTPITKINHIPETLKVITTSEKIPIVSAEQSVPIYVTPMPSSLSEKYNSTHTLNSGGFRTVTTTTMRPEVMKLLASIGLRPENTTNVEDVFKKNKEREDLEIKSEIPNSNGLIDTTSGLSVVVPDSPSISAQNTFENSVSEIGKGMNNLTPDIQLLFQRFGLETSNLVTTTMSTLKSTFNTNSYTNFKPLPTSKIKNEDMKEFLAKFGLGISDSRQKKAMSASTERPSLIEAVPSNMRQILENIGLISRKIPRTTPKMESIEEPAKMTKIHIFKPHEVRVKDEGQRMKINELLDKIRLVQEGKTNATDVRKVADDLLATTKTLKDGPDPLNLEEIIRIYNEDVKNEVKRQNPEKTVEITTNDDRVNTTTTGIKKFMISILGTSEFGVRQIIQGLGRIRRMLTNMRDKMQPPD